MTQLCWIGGQKMFAVDAGVNVALRRQKLGNCPEKCESRKNI